MTIWMKIAAGLLGGLAIVASLSSFGGKKKENIAAVEEEIPDEIFDGERQTPKKTPELVRTKNEQNIRNLQDGLIKASNILGHISIICNSILKMFYEDPCIRVTPTTYII